MSHTIKRPLWGALLGLLLVPSMAVAEEPKLDPALPADCEGRTDVLGLSRVVEIDTTGAPRFGSGQYKDNDFLEDGEIVLTFDDGPMRRYTLPILDALDAQCTRATFFAVGRMAIADPETLRETARRGHTIASHTWSHKNLQQLSSAKAKDEVELGISAVSAALGEPLAPFFRFPYLGSSKAMTAHLAGRNQAIFSIDVDSKDFRTRNPGTVMRTVIAQLKANKKGIILFHDIQPSTAGALAALLANLQKDGFKVVHIVPKSKATTLPEYDAIAGKALAKKAVALSKSPLATRAVNWPETAETPSPNDAVTGPQPETAKAEPDVAPAPRSTKSSGDKHAREDHPSEWRAFETDSFGIRPFGGL